ncbi:hypothetical protein QCA50_016955 [Cerrena zonata]|uniref:Uncharacterized protein n=1 Tax=Cerrena zonata TaxID=2478898 RepID=A0AAW0FKC5_9APHY
MAFDPRKDYYKTLGADHWWTEQRIVHAWQEMGSLHFRNKREFRKIMEAKDVLMDKRTRCGYDIARFGRIWDHEHENGEVECKNSAKNIAAQLGPPPLICLVCNQCQGCHYEHAHTCRLCPKCRLCSWHIEHTSPGDCCPCPRAEVIDGPNSNERVSAHAEYAPEKSAPDENITPLDDLARLEESYNNPLSDVRQFWPVFDENMGEA